MTALASRARSHDPRPSGARCKLAASGARPRRRGPGHFVLMSPWRRRGAGLATLLLTLLVVVVAAAGQARAAAAGGAALPPSVLLEMQTPAPTGRIVVKFVEAAGVIIGDDGVRSRSPGKGEPARIQLLLAQAAPGAVIARRFSRDAGALDAARLAAEARTGGRLPDLNTWAQLTPSPSVRGDRASLLAIVKRLLADPLVEYAFLEPVAVPAMLGFDAFTGDVPGEAVRGEAVHGGAARGAAAPGGDAAPASSTPDYSSLQGYLEPAPTGVGALAMAAQPGALGAGVNVIDVEGAWLWSHEDLALPYVELGAPINNLGWRNHGTAVMGVVRGEAGNALGVRGIAPQVGFGGSSIGDQSVADAISNAAAALAPGDIILIELHAPGPNANGSGQYGYVPMEFWQDNFDAMVHATAAGVIVCEAAGNGQQNLDDPIYQGLFDRQVRDSGAIMCGASNGASLGAAWFTNNGTRVDLHGWGFNVTTTGYGALQGDPLPETEWYTNAFNGTSSASPIVVGAVAALQGMVKTAYGFPLDARLARDILRQTGTPHTGTVLIGPRPDLVAAWDLAAGGIGQVAGVVRDAGTLQPLSDVRVEVSETGAFDLTGDAGGYGFALLPGAYQLAFSSFFYGSVTEGVAISGGATTVRDVVLTPLPTVTFAGRVYDTAGSGLGGVRIAPLGTPLASAASGAGGDFSLAGAPAGLTYTLRFDGKPGFGADVRQVTAVSPPDLQPMIFQELPAAAETFEAGEGGFTSSDPAVWSHGVPSGGAGPAAAFSGLRCWGVGMEGDYLDDQHGELTSPAYDFSAAPRLHLSFHYWSATEPGFDGVQLQIQSGGDWTVVTPLTGYSDQILGGLGNGAGWSGATGEWRGAVFDLSPWRAPALRFRLVFGSDAGVTGAGFWVDDIAFDTGDVVTAVGSDGQLGGAADGPPARSGPALAAHPNPFNPQTRIDWRTGGAGPLRIDVHDVRGRLIRRLLDEPVAANAGAVTWDGRDAGGRPAPSGVYLIRLRDAAGGSALLSVLLAK